MPVTPAEAPQWILNLSVVAAAIATALTGWFIKRREVKAEPPAVAPGIAVVGGALIDARLIERLSDALEHNTRATRDDESAKIDNTREVKRACELMGDVRRAVEARNAAMQAEDARQLAAIDAAVVKARAAKP